MISHIGKNILYIHIYTDSYAQDKIYKELLQIHKKKSNHQKDYVQKPPIYIAKRRPEWPISIEKGAQINQYGNAN